MIARRITDYIIQLANEFPVVTVVGPRQSGKSTLVKALFPSYEYVSLEDYDVRAHAFEDPRGFLSGHKEPMILDEIQRVPELLGYIQSAVNRVPGHGKFILTGSYQPRLKAEIAQSLAGRTAIATLFPFSMSELPSASKRLSTEEIVFKGFMPRLFAENITPTNLYRAYYQTYVERDARQLINLSNQREFEIFVRLLAGRIGQLVNLEGLSGEIGVSSKTLAGWLNVLEASYIIRRLPPWFRNFGKRLIKTPKIYFVETGLACWLLGIKRPDQIRQHPLAGNLFENMIVMEALKHKLNAGSDADLYFIRDAHGLEADLAIDDGLSRWIYEIRSARTFHGSFCDNLIKLHELAPEFHYGGVVYDGEQSGCFKDVPFRNFRDEEFGLPC